MGAYSYIILSAIILLAYATYAWKLKKGKIAKESSKRYGREIVIDVLVILTLFLIISYSMATYTYKIYQEVRTT